MSAHGGSESVVRPGHAGREGAAEGGGFQWRKQRLLYGREKKREYKGKEIWEELPLTF